MLRVRNEHPIKRVVVMARQPPCHESMGHRDREGLKPARRQGCFEVVRGLKLAQRLLDADFSGRRRAHKHQRPCCTNGSAAAGVRA